MKRGNMKLQNRKGLSTIVATLIIILLTLVAVGIIWVVIRNVVEGGAEQIDVSEKCIAVSLEAVSVTEGSPGVYAVTLKRGADSEGDIGVKVNVFLGPTTSSGVLNFGAFGELDALGTVTKTITTVPTLAGGDKIEFTAFFKDDSGNEQFCSQTNEFTF